MKTCGTNEAMKNNPSPADELREMSSDQLEAQLKSVQKDLFRLKVQASVEKIDAPSNLKKFRREIARIKTVLRQRELEGSTATADA